MSSKRSLAARALALFGVLAIVLTACGGGATATPTNDANLQITQVAQTVQAELTRIAALTPSPTPTLPVTATPTAPAETPTTSGTAAITPVALADNAGYVSDVTVPDNTQFAPGQKFTKTWRIMNSGSNAWTTSYKLTYISGDLMGDAKQVTLAQSVPPGQQFDISVDLVAPSQPGTYKSSWQMVNANGTAFGDQVYVQIVVSTSVSTPTSAASPTAAQATATGAPTTAPTTAPTGTAQ